MDAEGLLNVADFSEKGEGGDGGGSGSLPVGTIISYMGTSAPKHYLACDGAIYQMSEYEGLAEHIKTNFGSYDFFGGDGATTFAVPDLRGEFLRGSGTNSHAGQGSGAATAGRHQDATVFNGFLGGNGNNILIWCDADANSPTNADSYTARTTNPKATTALNTGTTALTQLRHTARPTNTSVLYCIKYR